MAVNLELYRVFLVVAHAKSISQAARKLYISQPAVTQAIKQLERELGGALFSRGAHGVKLTHEGELMLEFIEKALALIDTAEDHFTEMLNLDRGHISIGASDTICKYFLLPYIEKFRNMFPMLEIHVTNKISSETIELVKSGAVDLGFVNLPVRDDNQLEVIPCFDLHDCFVCSPSYQICGSAGSHQAEDRGASSLWSAAANKEPPSGASAVPSSHRITPAELAAHPLLLLEKGSNTRYLMDNFFEERSVAIKPAFELGSFDLIVEFAKIGLGVACVYEEFVKEELERGELVKVELSEALPTRSIGLVHMQKIPMSLAAENFTSLIFNAKHSDGSPK
ncbi:MAG: LysR family transcriptional regulator [Oscillospiraceae bacterium]|jgi:DNA-binding transcriptional LysR family regulator|nr:LysR family transcriptional regulator [Oscillospiraceae bacterium]